MLPGKNPVKGSVHAVEVSPECEGVLPLVLAGQGSLPFTIAYAIRRSLADSRRRWVSNLLDWST